MKYKLLFVIASLAFIAACGDGCKGKPNAKLSTDDFDLAYALEWVQQHEGDLSDLQKAVNDPTQKFHNVDTNEDNMLDFIRIKEHRKKNSIIVEFVAYPSGEKEKDPVAVASMKVEKKGDGKVALSGQYPSYVEGAEKSYYPPTDLTLPKERSQAEAKQVATNASGGLDTTDVLLLMWLMNSNHEPYHAPMGRYYEPHRTWSGKGSFRKHARTSRKSAVTASARRTARTVKRIKPKKRPKGVKAAPTARKIRSKFRSRSRSRGFKSGNRTRTPRTRTRSRSFRPTRSFRSGRRSSIQYKQNVHYLEQQELEELAQEVNELQLTTWAYKDDPETKHLGIIVEDVDEQSPLRETSVRDDSIDLYGLSSLNIAVNQKQNDEIQALVDRVLQLEQEVAQCRSSM